MVVRSSLLAILFGALSTSLQGAEILNVKVNLNDRGNTIPESFLGVGFYWSNYRSYMGSSSSKINKPLQTVFNRLAQNSGPTPIRIGGVSTAFSWYNPNDAKQPEGIELDITPSHLKVLKDFSGSTKSRYTLALNSSTQDLNIFQGMAEGIIDNLGESKIQQFEVGNEPDRYGIKGQRPNDWNYDKFEDEFQNYIERFRSQVSTEIDLVGPTFAMVEPETVQEDTEWNARGPEFMDRYGWALSGYAMTRYPFSDCTNDKKAPRYPNVSNLLKDRASVGQAAALSQNIYAAQARGLRFVLPEINTASCGGRSGTSDRFASALWLVDTAFAFAQTGADQMFLSSATQGSYYSPLLPTKSSTGILGIEVKPLYYGMVLFSEAAPAGSRILNLSQSKSKNIRAWGTVEGGNTVRIAIINKEKNSSGDARIRIPGATQGTLVRLIGDSLSEKDDIEYAGQTYKGTKDGKPKDSRTELEVRANGNGEFVIDMPEGSAALLTVEL